jgi:carboxyl-terminal processing protease
VERSEPEKRKRNLDDNEFVNNSQSKMKLVVLINRYTARLYEAVAGTIKDNKTGTLIGEKTMGIGNSQKIFPMANHSAIKLTVSQLYTPRGRSINGKGIKPDISISMEPGHAGTDDDVQLKEAISYLKGKQK